MASYDNNNTDQCRMDWFYHSQGWHDYHKSVFGGKCWGTMTDGRVMSGRGSDKIKHKTIVCTEVDRDQCICSAPLIPFGDRSSIQVLMVATWTRI